MNKLHRFYVALIFLQLIVPVNVTLCYSQVPDTIIAEKSEKIYAIQVAASKVFIEPEYFKQKFSLSEDVRYFQKDGWYKYVIGSYKNKDEAARRMPELKFEAFITFLYEKPVPDTLQPARQDTIKPQKDESKLRRIYNQKIRQADSAFNIAKNLLLAKMLYQEVSLISPEKNYPRDQIIEIDKLLSQKESPSIFSKMPLRIFIIGGITFLFFLVLLIFLIRRLTKRNLNEAPKIISPAIEKAPEPVAETGIKSGSAIHPISTASDQDYERMAILGEIICLYANLSAEISTRLNESQLDEYTDRESVRMLKSSLIHVREEGFRNLGLTYYQIIIHEIDSCLNSPNEVLRIEAELAFLRLHPDDPFSFLDKLNLEFSPWEQLHVFELIKRLHIRLPDFSRWLTSPNESVVGFSKRMLQAFKQTRATGLNSRTGLSGSDEETGKGIDQLIGKPGEDLQAVALDFLNNRINKMS